MTIHPLFRFTLHHPRRAGRCSVTIKIKILNVIRAVPWLTSRSRGGGFWRWDRRATFHPDRSDCAWYRAREMSFSCRSCPIRRSGIANIGKPCRGSYTPYGSRSVHPCIRRPAFRWSHSCTYRKRSGLPPRSSGMKRCSTFLSISFDFSRCSNIPCS